MALTADGRHWFLVNATPDIRAQLGSFVSLHPSSTSPRNSPVEAILLTNADLDHTAGILLLREGDPLHLHAAKTVRRSLTDDLGFTALLTAFCGVIWHEPPRQWQALPLKNGEPSGISYRAIPLASPPPLFSPSKICAEEQTVAYVFKDDQTGGTALIAPDAFEINESLLSAMQEADAVLFDGTFWSEDELGGVKPSARKASDMGHLTIKDGSLDLLSQLPARHRIYLHINNTNPILRPDRPERQAVERAGIMVGYDGMELEL